MQVLTSKPVLYTSMGAAVIGGGVLIKDYVGGKKYEGTDDLTNKIVVITGGNSGIGKETAKALSKRKAKVILACRDIEKCHVARRDVILDSKNKYVYCRECDLASQESIRRFVKRFKTEFGNLHILINNGAVMGCSKSHTKEGIELQLGVNHMGHFLLTNLLLDTLKSCAPSRIINVTSSSCFTGKIKADDLNSTKHYEPLEAYKQSKLANILFTKELAKKLKDTGVTVIAVHPGLANTDLGRHSLLASNIFTKYIIAPLTWPFIKSAKQGAYSVEYAALEPSLEQVSGAYVSNLKPTEVSDVAKNEKVSRWLWAVSEKWTRLNVE